MVLLHLGLLATAVALAELQVFLVSQQRAVEVAVLTVVQAVQVRVLHFLMVVVVLQVWVQAVVEVQAVEVRQQHPCLWTMAVVEDQQKQIQ